MMDEHNRVSYYTGLVCYNTLITFSILLKVKSRVEINYSLLKSARALTWSTYKSHNTAKFIIGIAPQGTICFISKRWEGRTSDQFITENSNFLKYVQYGDVIMADR